jgi:hypothetical protein
MRRMRGRALRAPLAVAVCVVALTAIPASAIPFGPTQRAAPPYSWNPGRSLVATPTRLLSIYATDCPHGRCADDNGPRMGVFVRRSPSSNQRPDWAKAKRLSPPTRQAERPSIASDGTTVIASYVTQRSYLHYRPGAPRAVWVRVSTDQGASWRSPVRLSGRAGRVDYPRVAAGGGRVFAVWTAAGSGDIRLAWSDDRGRHWTKATIGSTTSKPFGAAEGFAGLPDVAASGDDVAVAWFANDDGRQVAVTSSSGGDDLVGKPRTVLTTKSPNRGPQYPAVGEADDPSDPRVAIAYTTPTGLDVVTFDGVSVSSPSHVLTWPVSVGGVRYRAGYGPAVVPYGAAEIAVAVAGCRRNTAGKAPCATLARGSRIDVLYGVSTDDGATWDPLQRLTNAAHKPYRINDEPSIALTGPTHRVSFDRYERRFRHYDVWLRSSR